jgi:hypothetical protein
MLTGWDGAIYVNEETTRRRTNPGKAVMIAVTLLAVIYTLATVGLQGVVSPAKLQTNAASALVYVAQALGGSGWGKVMALSVALSAIASTGAGIVITARIVYGMAGERVLPTFLGTVNRRFSTPAAAGSCSPPSTSSPRWPPWPTTGAASWPGPGTWCGWACCRWPPRGSSAGSSSSRCCRPRRTRTGRSWAWSC